MSCDHKGNLRVTNKSISSPSISVYTLTCYLCGGSGSDTIDHSMAPVSHSFASADSTVLTELNRDLTQSNAQDLQAEYDSL